MSRNVPPGVMSFRMNCPNLFDNITSITGHGSRRTPTPLPGHLVVLRDHWRDSNTKFFDGSWSSRTSR